MDSSSCVSATKLTAYRALSSPIKMRLFFTAGTLFRSDQYPPQQYDTYCNVSQRVGSDVVHSKASLHITAAGMPRLMYRPRYGLVDLGFESRYRQHTVELVYNVMKGDRIISVVINECCYNRGL
jgi:hypothetical protein